jgi:hypothetical protein
MRHLYRRLQQKKKYQIVDRTMSGEGGVQEDDDDCEIQFSEV